MFKHVFASMNEKLNEIMIHYPNANADQKKLHDEQLAVLKQFSDTFIEQWLQFEEKMADFRDLQLDPSIALQQGQSSPQGYAGGKPPYGTAHNDELKPPADAILGSATEAYASGAAAHAEEAVLESEAEYERTQTMMRGQGYFKLFMFRQAAQHFEEAVRLSPDDNRALLFLAMTYMHLQEWHEAQRHFQFLVEVTDYAKWRALALNALGCIQAVRMNLEQAAKYFEKAHEADPEFADPLSNMKSCQQQAGHLSLYFGSGQL
ncbi:hypothetical protein Back11_22980 [Paenibacillus baekrokdamisoli]|uniref:Uncharacterized protein n=2 Tax=Paenibacillus baekrokdamisoli TaxID=1712516 RepID=A0A3G9J7T3_9BACL|nr:hypothetical protein Back11_22980 [Paenibacillus baekrokdamisoli]